MIRVFSVVAVVDLFAFVGPLSLFLLLLVCINDEALEVKNWSAAAGGILFGFLRLDFGFAAVNKTTKSIKIFQFGPQTNHSRVLLCRL